MHIINEPYFPTIKDAKRAHKDTSIRKKRDLPTKYTEYFPCLATTNELCQTYNVKPYITNESKILTINGSGEQLLFFLLFGANPKNITTFDISYNSYIMTLLKIAAIRTFDTNTKYNEFIYNLINTEFKYCLKNETIYKVVQNLGDTEKKYFYDSIKYNLDVYYNNGYCDYYELSTPQYDKLKKKVTQEIPFIWTNVTELFEKLGNQKFDIIYYSNIFSFMDLDDTQKILDTTIEHLNHNGRIFLTDSSYIRADDIINCLEQHSDELDIGFSPRENGFLQILIQKNPDKPFEIDNNIPDPLDIIYALAHMLRI